MKKILIIDDEKFMRRTIVSALRQEGFETLETENGVDGVQVARDRHPDLILCDVRMEKMDGYATLAALRDDPATATIPFVLMTAMAERAGMRQGMLLGADDYLPKPFSVDDLIATVNARFTKQKAWKKQADEKLAGVGSNLSFCLPHALLTPLTEILDSSKLLRTEAPRMSVEDTVETADAINVAAHELQRAIENHLLLAQAELIVTDEQKLADLRRRRTVVSRQMLETLAGNVARNAQRVADLEIQSVEARLTISDDYFRKILSELLAHALSHSPSGSPVRLTAHVEASGFALTVTDTGPALTPEQLALLGPSMQFEQHMSLPQGVGIGLVLARRLAELHGGSFRIRAEANRGTIIEVHLPVVGQ